MTRTLLCAAAMGLLTLNLAGCPDLGPTARVRIVHASPDAPAVDICGNGVPLVWAGPLSFSAATPYLGATPGTYAVRVVAADAACDSAAVIEASLSLGLGTDTTVVAIDRLAAIHPLVLADDNSAPAVGQARIRFVHASPDAPTVDITLEDGTTLYDDVAFGENGGYISLPAGTYTLQLRDATGTDLLLTLAPLPVTGGNVYTLFAVGLLNGQPAIRAFITIDRTPLG